MCWSISEKYMWEEKIKWLVRGPFKPLAIMTTTQGVTQQVAHSMTTQGTIPFSGFLAAWRPLSRRCSVSWQS